MFSLAIPCPLALTQILARLSIGVTRPVSFFSSSRSNIAFDDNLPSRIGTIPKCMWGVLVHVYARISNIWLAIILCKIVFGSFKNALVCSWSNFSKSLVRGYNPLITEDCIFTDCPLGNLVLVHVFFYLLFVGQGALAIRQLIVGCERSVSISLFEWFSKCAHYVDKLHQGSQLSFFAFSLQYGSSLPLFFSVSRKWLTDEPASLLLV